MAEQASSSQRGKASSEAAPAAELIAGNVDLLTEILSRVPAKPLIRFKCVSKHWRSLVSDPQFARIHSRRNPRPSISGLYINSGHGRIGSVSFGGGGGGSALPTLSFPDGIFRILHSCNGLLLASGFSDKDLLIVCNPTTQEYFELPPPPHGRGSYGSGCLAFDPSKSHHYKVVLLGRQCSARIDVYSSESGCWKTIPTQNGGYQNGVFWRGAIHWLSDPGRGFFRFEVEEETMIVTPSPARPKILPYLRIRYFGECGGRLVLIQARESRPGFRILAMDEDYSRWTVDCWVDLNPLVLEFPDDRATRYGGCPVLCVLEGEEEKEFVLVLAISGRLISYNSRRKTWNVLPQWVPVELTNDIGNFDFGYPFLPSLSTL